MQAMLKKIGKLFLIIFLFFNSNASSNLKLHFQICDLNGNRLEHAATGIPFLLELNVESDNSDISSPTIENISNYLIANKGVSSSFTQRNNQTIVKKYYQYELRIDKEGKFKVGPVYINGSKHNCLFEINVKKDSKQLNNAIIKSAFLKISVDNVNPYIGQEIQLTIKFYYKDEVKLLNIEFAQLKDFDISKEISRQSRQEFINNDYYDFHEFKYLIYPKTTGNLFVPSLKAKVQMPAKHNNFFGFFVQPYENKEIISNTLNINAKVLPGNQFANAVGNFRNFKAEINQKTATKGEAVVLKLQIEGKGNLENLKFKDLRLPDGFTYYESKNYVESINDSEWQRKIFEFILQSNKVCKEKISSQEFIYFDPIRNKFNSLFSDEFCIDILDFKHSPLHHEVYSIKSIVKEIKIDNNNFLSFYYFNLLFIFPVLIWLLILIINFINDLNVLKNYKRNKKVLINIKKATKARDFNFLYNSLYSYFQHEFLLNQSDLTHESILNKLRLSDIKIDKIIRWENFFQNTLRNVFNHTEVDKNLFIEAEYLIADFQKSKKLFSNKSYFVFFALLNFTFVKPNQELLLAGNALYNEKKYDAALKVYESIKTDSFAKWFNIGNANYNLKQFVYAFYAWKKSEKFARTINEFELIQHNISFVQKELNLGNTNNKFDQMYDFVIKCLALIPLLYFQIIFLFVWYIIIFYLFMYKKNRYFLLIILICSSIVFIQTIISKNGQSAIVVKNDSILHSGPDNSFHELGRLNAAAQVKIKQQKNDWFKIQSNDIIGWIEKASIKIL